MSAYITVHVLSGLPNPTWELTPDQISQLRDRLRGLRETWSETATDIIGTLGYSGVEIETSGEPELEASIFASNGSIGLGPGQGSLRDPDRSFERWAIDTDPGVIPGLVREHIMERLLGPQLIGRRGGPAKARVLEVPIYEPSVWNTDPNIRRNNNCYNYASNLMTGTFAQPGRGSGAPFTNLTGVEVCRAAVSDGLEALARRDPPQETRMEGHFMALVIWPGVDYHFYRLDDNALWSHKPGQTAARDVDGSGNQISDPQVCDRGPYTEFTAYLYIIPAHTNIN